jgi:hypothetical protein
MVSNLFVDWAPPELRPMDRYGFTMDVTSQFGYGIQWVADIPQPRFPPRDEPSAAAA